MIWQIITCNNSKHIVPVQKHLFKKYVPNAELKYIDLGDEPTESWTHNVLAKLDTSQEYLILGLDDFLPVRDFPFEELIPVKGFSRLELSGHKQVRLLGEEPYRVSCQFSIWKTANLVELLKIKRTPWQFEVKGELKGNVYHLESPVWYIEESAISGRQKGKINLCGLKKKDIDELIYLKLVNENDIIYGWKGNSDRTKESYGEKYKEFYEEIS